MTPLKDAIDAGRYAQQQVHSRDRLIAWSHRGRFQTAVSLGRQFAGQRVLDLGPQLSTQVWFVARKGRRSEDGTGPP